MKYTLTATFIKGGTKLQRTTPSLSSGDAGRYTTPPTLSILERYGITTDGKQRLLCQPSRNIRAPRVLFLHTLQFENAFQRKYQIYKPLPAGSHIRGSSNSTTRDTSNVPQRDYVTLLAAPIGAALRQPLFGFESLAQLREWEVRKDRSHSSRQSSIFAHSNHSSTPFKVLILKATDANTYDVLGDISPDVSVFVIFSSEPLSEGTSFMKRTGVPHYFFIPTGVNRHPRISLLFRPTRTDFDLHPANIRSFSVDTMIRD